MAAPMTSATASQRLAGVATTTTTEVVHETQPSPSISPPPGTLRLRGVREPARRIQWASDVIDNEGMGKKSSKVCCIYHKIRAPDESSEDESSDSSSESDSESEPDTSRARPTGSARRSAGRNHNHKHNHNHDHGESKDKEGDAGPSGSNGQPKPRARKPSPNAYERQPKYGKKKTGGSS